MTDEPRAPAWRATFAAIAFLAAFALNGAPASAGEPEAGAWDEGHGARVRLVAGPLLATGEQIVGVHIALDPGWHTYWRNPGDSGAPPVFDWSQSANVAAATPEYPAPISLPDPWGVSIGYLDEVVFPVVIAPEASDAALGLKLDLSYAACREICVPQSAALSLDIAPSDSPPPGDIGLVNHFRALVPRAQAGGEEALPRITAAHPETSGDGVVLTVAASGEGPAELFVTGPPRYYFAVPSPASGGPDNSLTFSVEVDGADEPGDLTGAELQATLVAGDGAVEYSWIVE